MTEEKIEFEKPKTHEEQIEELTIEKITPKVKTELKTLNKIKGWNKKTLTFVRELLYEGQKEQYVGKTYAPKKLFRFYVAEFGRGNPFKIIITPGENALSLGDNTLYLSKYDLKEDEFNVNNNIPKREIALRIFLLCDVKFHGKISEKSDEVLWDVVAEHHKKSTVFLKLDYGIDEKDIRNLKPEEHRELLKLALTDGLSKDHKLLYCFRSKIPQAEPSLIAPQQYMPFNDHSLIYTFTGAGKTFTAAKIGKTFDRMSIPNMLGSDNMKQRTEGELNQQTQPYFGDEIQEEENQNIIGKLFSFLERGDVNINVGRGLSCRGYSSLTLMGNPRTKGETDPEVAEQQNLQMFLNMLQTISENCKALGRRIACLLYAPIMKTVQGNPYEFETQERLQDYLITMVALHKSDYTRLFLDKEIQRWLNNSEIDVTYKNQIKSMIEETPIPIVRDFFQGFLENYRHMRGFSLKQAFIDLLPEYATNNKPTTEKILKLAEDHFLEVQHINLESCKKITNRIKKDSTEIIKKSIETLNPLYLRIILNALLEYCCKNPNYTRIIVLEELHKDFLNIKGKFGDNKYSKEGWNTTIEALTNDLQKVNSVLSDFELSIAHHGKSLTFRILNKELFEKYALVYSGKSLESLGSEKKNDTIETTQTLSETHNVVVEEVKDEAEEWKNTQTGRFRRVDPTYQNCKNCGESHSKGWSLEKEDGSIWCDICAGVG